MSVMNPNNLYTLVITGLSIFISVYIYMRSSAFLVSDFVFTFVFENGKQIVDMWTVIVDLKFLRLLIMFVIQ